MQNYFLYQMNLLKYYSILIFCFGGFLFAQLPTPTFIRVEATPNSIAIEWTPIKTADGYEVAIIGKKQQNMYVGNTSLVWTDAKPGNIYSIYILAYQLNGEHSKQCSYWLLTPPEMQPAKMQKNGFVAQWKRSIKTKHYYFYLSEDVNFKNIIPSYNGVLTDKNKLKIKNILPNRTYYCRIKVIDEYGQEHLSNTISIHF